MKEARLQRLERRYPIRPAFGIRIQYADGQVWESEWYQRARPENQFTIEFNDQQGPGKL